MEVVPEIDEDEEGDYYVRCPDEDCEFIEEDIPEREAYSMQNNGCPNCDDNRSLAVSTMDNL